MNTTFPTASPLRLARPMPWARLGAALAMLALGLAGAALLGAGTSKSLPATVLNGLIAFDSGDGNLYVADPDGGRPRLFLDADHELRWPVWSPDGSRLAYFEMVATGPGRTDDKALVHVVDANGHADRDRTGPPS